MKKNLVLYLLCLLPFFACDQPVPAKKADIIQIDKITRHTDVTAEHPGLHFMDGAISGSEFKDERYMQFYDIPVSYLRIQVNDSQTNIERISIQLPKSREEVKALKEKLNKAYGQPGEDSSNDFSTADEGQLLVWKNEHQLIGLYTDKTFETTAKIAQAPTVDIVFVKPAETNN
jgi:hypothetical protein